MLYKNQVSIEIPQEHLKALSLLIADLEAALSPIVKLTDNRENETMNDKGFRSLAYLNKSFGETRRKGRLTSSYNAFSVEDLQNNIEALKQLQPLLKQIQQVADSLDDTFMQCAANHLYNASNIA